MAKKIIAMLTFGMVFMLLIPGQAEARRSWGLGIIVGEPIGFSMKTWTGHKTAIDAAIAWSFSEERLYIHTDYLVHNFKLINVDVGRFPIYYGIGGRVHFSRKTHIGVRAPLGICYIFDNQQLDIFFEIAPTMNLVPETRFYVSLALGARYFFK